MIFTSHTFSGSLPSLKMSRWIATVLVFANFLGGCGKPAREPVTLNYPHGWWSEPDEIARNAALAHRFTQDTGIHIRDIPTPENTQDGLDLEFNLLRRGSSGADLVHVDLIWSSILEPELIDLRPYSSTELTSIDPQLLPSYTTDGKLISIPYQVNIGALEYRTDLLREYGYSHPPKTWDELESMAAHIQTGERAKGHKDFWGYVWQGADAESLACNALEWQVSEGGGRIIESDKTISLNNPRAIRAWQRAKGWIGKISPPSVVAYQERDSQNMFDSGQAAFNRIWLGRGITRKVGEGQIYWRPAQSFVPTSFSSIPGGSVGSAATLGGFGLAVSARSDHRQEAVQYLLYLIRAQIEHGETSPPYGTPSKLPDGRLASDAYIRFAEAMEGGTTLVNRPAIETGRGYRKVSEAYAHAVHSVLTGERKAQDAATELEAKLMTMTGLQTARRRKGTGGALDEATPNETVRSQ